MEASWQGARPRSGGVGSSQAGVMGTPLHRLLNDGGRGAPTEGCWLLTFPLPVVSTIRHLTFSLFLDSFRLLILWATIFCLNHHDLTHNFLSLRILGIKFFTPPGIYGCTR